MQMFFHGRNNQPVTERSFLSNDRHDVFSSQRRKEVLQRVVGQDVYVVVLGKIVEQFLQLPFVKVEGHDSADFEKVDDRRRGLSFSRYSVQKGSVGRKVPVPLIPQVDNKDGRVDDCQAWRRDHRMASSQVLWRGLVVRRAF